MQQLVIINPKQLLMIAVVFIKVPITIVLEPTIQKHLPHSLVLLTLIRPTILRSLLFYVFILVVDIVVLSDEALKFEA